MIAPPGICGAGADDEAALGADIQSGRAPHRISQFGLVLEVVMIAARAGDDGGARAAILSATTTTVPASTRA
jgi:hypothetical protein